MRAKTLYKWLLGSVGLGFLAVPVILSLAPERAMGTDTLMRSLPAYNRFQCVLCHTSEQPVTGNAPLNVFGVDFRDNGSVWDAALAKMNSDGDRCTNGFEVGDRDGDGVFDNYGGQPLENGNPSDPNDCTVPVDASTWGIIKEIFSKEIPNSIEESSLLLENQFSLHFP